MNIDPPFDWPSPESPRSTIDRFFGKDLPSDEAPRVGPAVVARDVSAEGRACRFPSSCYGLCHHPDVCQVETPMGITSPQRAAFKALPWSQSMAVQCGEIPPASGCCRYCGDLVHPLREPETSEGIRVGKLLVEPSPEPVDPRWPWCIHSAEAHSSLFEQYPSREDAIAEAQRRLTTNF